MLLNALVAAILRDDTSGDSTTVSRMETVSPESEKNAERSDIGGDGLGRGLSFSDT